MLLHIKLSEKEGFLFEIPAATDVDTVLREVVKVNNLRRKVNRLADAAQQLSQYGPMKLPEQQGLEAEGTPFFAAPPPFGDPVVVEQLAEDEEDAEPPPTWSLSANRGGEEGGEEGGELWSAYSIFHTKGGIHSADGGAQERAPAAPPNYLGEADEFGEVADPFADDSDKVLL